MVAARRVGELGWRIGNIDSTVVAQAPRLAPHIEAMRARIAGVLGLEADAVNVKAKTAERLGPVGQGQAIEARAVVLLRDRGVSEWWLMLTLGIIGLGQGVVISPNQTLALSEVPLKYAGSAGGVMQTGQRVGTSVGIAMITAVAFGVISSHGWAAGITAGLGVVVLVILVALAVALVDMRHRARQDAQA